MDTLPGWAMKLKQPLDRLREVVRRDERLKGMGVRLGTARVFSEEEAKAIVAAWLEKQAKRKSAVA